MTLETAEQVHNKIARMRANIKEQQKLLDQLEAQVELLQRFGLRTENIDRFQIIDHHIYAKIHTRVWVKGETESRLLPNFNIRRTQNTQ
jgi:hypothetical protein